MDLSMLIVLCAPMVAKDTMAELVRVESGGQPWVINVNGVGPVGSGSLQEAEAKARRYIEAGRSVDLGLAQINSRNLSRLGLSVAQVLDPCTNLGAGGQLLAEAYARASAQYGPGREALAAALSAYNTGDFRRGLRNGYVARYGLAPRWEADPYAAGTAVDFTINTKEGSRWSAAQ